MGPHDLLCHSDLGVITRGEQIELINRLLGYSNEAYVWMEGKKIDNNSHVNGNIERFTRLMLSSYPGNIFARVSPAISVMQPTRNEKRHRRARCRSRSLEVSSIT